MGCAKDSASTKISAFNAYIGNKYLSKINISTFSFRTLEIDEDFNLKQVKEQI